MWRMFTGVEATTDYWVTFRDLSHLKEWIHLGNSLTNAYTRLNQDKGEEEVIDPISENELTRLLELLESYGVEVTSALGGNAALEVMAGKTQGFPVSFFGALPQLNISKPELEMLQEAFVGEFVDETPLSLIIQLAQGTTERYILNKGNGRRAMDVLPSFLKAKSHIKGDHILLGFVGVHVLFGTKQFDLLTTYSDVLEELRGNVGMTYSDTGGFSFYTPSELKKLFEHIYARVDALALNEVELLNVYNALEGPEVNAHPVEMLAYLINQFEPLKTVWLHTKNFQVSMSTELAPLQMRDAMKQAAAAGCFRIETGKPPTRAEIFNLVEHRRLNSRGITIAQEINRSYGKIFQNAKIVIWPSYHAEKFVTSVGAGDTACITYFCNLVQP